MAVLKKSETHLKEYCWLEYRVFIKQRNEIHAGTLSFLVTRVTIQKLGYQKKELMSNH